MVSKAIDPLFYKTKFDSDKGQLSNVDLNKICFVPFGKFYQIIQGIN
jgi:hypothetical protein